MLKVLVTGAGGFVGSRVCQLLIKKKIKVVATYNSNKINIKNITYKRFNIYKKKNNFYKFFNKPSVLIHLAWPDLDNFNSKNHLKKNLLAQKRFLKNVIKNGLGNLVVAGTCFEYAKKNGKHSELDKTNPLTSYGKSKDLLRKFLFRLKKNINLI